MFGDRALLVRFQAEASPELTALLAGLARAAQSLDGVLDACPGLTTVLVETSSPTPLISKIPDLVDEVRPLDGELHEVELTYDGQDFGWACDHLKLSPGELIARHSERVYDVRLLGSPGFVYLSDVPKEIALPRLDEPRREVAAGSVGVGGRQTGIYGRPRPGGWRILARAERVPKVIPGDRVRFVPK